MSKETAKEKASNAVEAAIKKAAQIQARVMMAEMVDKKRSEGVKRREDTRRKILVGSMVLEQMKKNGVDTASLSYDGKSLNDWLVNVADRKLFNLHPL